MISNPASYWTHSIPPSGIRASTRAARAGSVPVRGLGARSPARETGHALQVRSVTVSCGSAPWNSPACQIVTLPARHAAAASPATDPRLRRFVAAMARFDAPLPVRHLTSMSAKRCAKHNFAAFRSESADVTGGAPTAARHSRSRWRRQIKGVGALMALGADVGEPVPVNASFPAVVRSDSQDCHAHGRTRGREPRAACRSS